VNHGVSEVAIEHVGRFDEYTFVVSSNGTFRYHGGRVSPTPREICREDAIDEVIS
jgi:hypothetical protein